MPGPASASREHSNSAQLTLQVRIGQRVSLSSACAPSGACHSHGLAIPQLFSFHQTSKHALLKHMDRDRLQDGLIDARVPEGLQDLVLAKGFDCPSDFAFAFPTIADLQPFIVFARDPTALMIQNSVWQQHAFGKPFG